MHSIKKKKVAKVYSVTRVTSSNTTRKSRENKFRKEVKADVMKFLGAA